MGVFIKTLAIALLVAVVGLFATGIERIVWMFSNGRLLAELPRKLYLPIAGIDCDKPSIEVKRDPDGVLRYRCGSYWLLSHEARSAELSAAWPEIATRLRK